VTIFLAAILLPAVWTVRNAFVFHEFIPVSASGWGAQVLCGTLDTELVGIKVWTGSNWALLDVGTHPLLQVDGEPSTTERERVYLHRGLRRIADHPVHWLGVRAIQYSKLFLDSGDYALGSHNVPVRQAVAESRFGVLLVKSAFGVGNLFVFAMALLGFYAERKRTPSIVHMIAFPIFLLFVHLVTSIESRYILPMMPMVAIFSAVGWQRLMQNSLSAIRRTDTQVQPSPGLEPLLFRTRAK
jgi:hypothetical protein